MAPSRRFVLSTVGISLLLKSTDNWNDLRDAANASDLSDATQRVVKDAAACALQKLNQGSVADRRKLSAELNGLYGLYEDQLHLGQDDFHYLLVTDTYIGKQAGKVVTDFLRLQGWHNVSTYCPPKLSTATAGDFSQGMKNLINWCEQTISGYRESGYEIVFNLTGGFKSLQGYLTIVGMFYADRIVYIFEAANELLTIPRLPIHIDESVFREYRVPLALMAEGSALLSKDGVAGIPDGLLEIVDGVVGLSNWGQLAWNRLRRDLLSEVLLDFPRIRYTSSFERDFRKADKPVRVDVQCKLAQASVLLVDNDGDVTALKQHHGLQYDNYTGQRTRDGKPIGHFRLDRGDRVSCVMQSDGTLLVDRWGGHDKVNKSP
jgi:putative CRISPR-associated protein (TIGR02619 family)